MNLMGMPFQTQRASEAKDTERGTPMPQCCSSSKPSLWDGLRAKPCDDSSLPVRTKRCGRGGPRSVSRAQRNSHLALTLLLLALGALWVSAPVLAQSQPFQQEQPTQQGEPPPQMQQAQPQMPGELPHPEVPLPHVLAEPTPLWIILVSVAVLLGLLVLLGYFLLRKTTQILASSTRRPLKDAMRAMKEVQNHADIMPPPEIGQRVSAILRRYFMDRYGLPAPFRTSQELFPSVELVAAPRRTRHIQERFAPLAAIYDTLEFGPTGGSREAAVALVSAVVSKLEEERLHEDTLAI